MKPYFITMEIAVTRSIRTLADAKTFLAKHSNEEAYAAFSHANSAQLRLSTPRGSLVQVLQHLAANPPNAHEEADYEIEFTMRERLDPVSDRAEIALLIQAATIV